MATMQTVRKSEPGEGLRIEEHQVPVAGPSEVVIKVEAASICGTDLQIFRGDDWIMNRMRDHLPLTIGHEFCGRVAEVGPNAHFKEDDYVSAEMHLACGHCFQCRNGFAHICDKTRICGIDLDGCFAEYIKIPASNVVALSNDIPIEIGAFLDALGNAVHTTQCAGEIRGTSIAVLGSGPIGCMAIAIARLSGADTIYATDVVETRLEAARTMGADQVFDVGGDGHQVFLETLEQKTQGRGVDLVFEMSGNPTAVHDSLKIIRKGGKVMLFGLGKSIDGLDLANDVVMKSVTVKGVIGRRMFETWDEMLNLLQAGLTDRLKPLVTHRFPLADYQNAIDLLREGEGLKAVLYPRLTSD